METTVRLASLPEGVQIPEPLAGRIHFDSQRKVLVFDGFMSKSVYDKLCHLSNDDDYRRAVEVLFRDSARALPRSFSASPPAGSHPYLKLLAVGALAIAGTAILAMWLL